MQRLRATTILRQDVVAVNGTFLTGSGISSPTRQGTPGLHPLAQGDHVPDPDADQQHPGRQKLPRYFGPDLRKVSYSGNHICLFSRTSLRLLPIHGELIIGMLVVRLSSIERPMHRGPLGARASMT